MWYNINMNKRKEVLILTIKTRTRKPKSEFENKLKWIRQNKTHRYVLEVELDYIENNLRKVLSASDELRIIRNTIVGELFKNYQQMVRSKKYKALILSSKENNKKINSLNKDDKFYEKDLKKLNKEIEKDSLDLGKGYRIGHSYFTPTEEIKDVNKWYKMIIKMEIEPLIREYWFDKSDEEIQPKVDDLLND